MPVSLSYGVFFNNINNINHLMPDFLVLGLTCVVGISVDV